MLFLGEEIFAVGRLRFADGVPGSHERSAKLHVPLSIGSVTVLAQLDTGAAWTMLGAELAGSVGLLGGQGPVVRLSTRAGDFEGRLERVHVTLIAEEGESLDVDATVFVSADWAGPNFLGWSGFLDRVRFAVDPSERRYFYFGPIS
jgi:hypothetical protein